MISQQIMVLIVWSMYIYRDLKGDWLHYGPAPIEKEGGGE